MDVNIYGQKPPRRSATIASVKSDTTDVASGNCGMHINSDGIVYVMLHEDTAFAQLNVYAGTSFRYPVKRIGNSTTATGYVFFE